MMRDPAAKHSPCLMRHAHATAAQTLAGSVLLLAHVGSVEGPVWQGTTSNGRHLLPFRTGAFLAGASVRPVLLRYGPGRVSPAWESIPPLWHAFLMLAHPLHSVTVLEVGWPSAPPMNDYKRADACLALACMTRRPR